MDSELHLDTKPFGNLLADPPPTLQVFLNPPYSVDASAFVSLASWLMHLHLSLMALSVSGGGWWADQMLTAPAPMGSWILVWGERSRHWSVVWFTECNKPETILRKKCLSVVLSLLHQAFLVQTDLNFPWRFFIFFLKSLSSAPFDQTIPPRIYAHWAKLLLDTVLHIQGRKQKLVFFKCFSGSIPAGLFSIQRPSWEGTQAIGSNLEGAIESRDGRYLEQLGSPSRQLID